MTIGEKITEKEILDSFKDAAVLIVFKKLSADERNAIIDNIISQKSEDKQTKTIIKHIDNLSNK